MHESTGKAGPSANDDRSAGELVKQLSEQVSRLVRDELRLRRATPPVPAEAVDSVKADIQEIKERAHP